jgi:hypothetical protein
VWMQEPRFEYEFPLPYIRTWNNYYPMNLNKGFNEFMDRHRDPKDIQKEILEVRKLGITGEKFLNSHDHPHVCNLQLTRMALKPFVLYNNQFLLKFSHF